ncbi:hypothetical protein WJX72_010343 [[Myrmecia] bisecta]|uniref:PHD-type domain-containing protein n=1 Tax=[Myrmecia] bisecta TaxID=41462 RepID=A0AAW1QGA7_9CHLO
MSYLKAYAVAIGSLLAGATFVHNIYKPDLTLPLSEPGLGPAKPAAVAAQGQHSSDSGSDYEDGSAAAGGADRFSEAVFQEFHAGFQEAPEVADEEGVYAEGLQRVKEHLHSAQSRATVCLICLETMRNDAAIWVCDKSCYCIFHLLCIQSWGRQQLAANALRAEQRLNPERFPVAAKEARESACWACPKCRAEYGSGEVPAEYRCFCGKQKDPKFDPWLAPHSCGDTCGRKLLAGCGHTCVLLCHPGPCPPCPRLVTSSCFCGKESARRRCGQHTFSCKKLCGRRLACGHRCPLRCHPGDCPDCSLTGTYSCACGAETRKLPCSLRMFHCTRVCGRPLACGRHTCQQVCHTGNCGGCPREGPRSCPCGKVAYTNLRCDEEAPTCGSTCDQLLPCGEHRCAERCHTGPCSATCRAITIKSCACGRTQKQAPCFENFRCERRCTNMKPCGRHQCKRRCCDGNCQPCEEVCGRRLSAAPSAQVPLWPLPRVQPVSFVAARTLAKKAVSDTPPAVQVAEEVQAHPPPLSPFAGAAGSGEGEACEVCMRRCEREKPCGHPCPLPCHSAEPCPLCNVEVQQGCHCGRSLVAVVCHALQQEEERAELLCCGKACHKALPRCPHLCEATCHPGPCPGASTCGEEVAVRCPCRRLKVRMRCQDVQAQLAKEGRAEGYDANTVLRLLACNAECEAAKRKRSKGNLAAEADAANDVPTSASSAKDMAAAGAPVVDLSPAPAVVNKGPRRRTRADREREREAAEAKAQETKRRQKRRHWLYIAGQVLMTFICCLAMIFVIDMLSGGVWLRSRRPS